MGITDLVSQMKVGPREVEGEAFQYGAFGLQFVKPQMTETWLWDESARQWWRVFPCSYFLMFGSCRPPQSGSVYILVMGLKRLEFIGYVPIICGSGSKHRNL